MPLSVKTYADINRTIVNNLHMLDRNAYDVVVGIPRSGVPPAAMIATHLQLPYADLEGWATKGIIYGRSGHRHTGAAKRILLVDDTCNKGGAMQRAMGVIKQHKPNVKVTRFAVYGPYQVERPKEICDIWMEVVHGPRCFEWNMWKHVRLFRWFFDMDGVLCRDPEKHENDDGQAYEHFIHTAEPLFLPQRPIGTIITSRNENWRNHTVAWLERHGVQYERLVMCPMLSKGERMRFMKEIPGGRGGWKASMVLDLARKNKLKAKPEFFIESNRGQAKVIARQAKIVSYCTSTQEVFRPGEYDVD